MTRINCKFRGVELSFLLVFRIIINSDQAYQARSNSRFQSLIENYTFVVVSFVRLNCM